MDVTAGPFGDVLTDAQRRARAELLGPPATARPPAGLVAGIRARLEAEVGGALARAARAGDAGRGSTLWVSKGWLRDLRACQGLVAARLAGEAPPFVHSARSAAGTLMHRAIQLDVADERSSDVRSVVERAATRLDADDREFRSFWRDLDGLDRAERLALAAARLALYREAFPPLERMAQPVAEQLLVSRLADGRVTLSGRIDLMLGRGPFLLVDFKDGAARPEHAEEMRFYALLSALVFGRPPARVATVFLDSMQWQAEEVGERVLEHAASRVAEIVRVAAALSEGTAPLLTPGPHCAWCPRAAACPVSAVRRTGRP